MTRPAEAHAAIERLLASYALANGSNTVVRGMYRDVADLDGDRWRFKKRAVEMFPGPRPES